MKLIAHRGYITKYIKENTKEAFDNALNNDFFGFECDYYQDYKTGYRDIYECESGWTVYSGSGANMKCQKPAKLG